MKQILISGYYGFDNAGDEAVLSGLSTSLLKYSPPGMLGVTALSIDPARTEALHHIPAHHRYKQLLKALLKTDLLLSGGGSLLQDVTSAHGVFYYLAVVRMAQIMGCKTMFAAQGIGPLVRKRSIKLTASVANRLDAITVRDEQSRSFLESIGVTKTIKVAADPALLLQASPEPKSGAILLSLRQWPELPESFFTDFAASLARIGLPRDIRALNMHGDSDAVAAAKVIDLLQQQQTATSDDDACPNFQALLDKIARSEMVIGMRLHALIFAAAAGVPVVGLSYDPKIDAFMRQIGQGDAFVNVGSSGPEQLAAVISEVWHTRRERAHNIKQALPALRLSAQKTADIALKLLQLP